MASPSFPGLGWLGSDWVGLDEVGLVRIGLIWKHAFVIGRACLPRQRPLPRMKGMDGSTSPTWNGSHHAKTSPNPAAAGVKFAPGASRVRRQDTRSDSAV